MFEEIVALLAFKNKLGYLKDINRMLLQELILFLSKFQSAILSLEQFKKPNFTRLSTGGTGFKGFETIPGGR